MIKYKKHTQTQVKRGENRGRTLQHRNSVIDIRQLKSWQGEAETYHTSIDDGDGVAIIIQQKNHGRILGSAWTE